MEMQQSMNDVGSPRQQPPPLQPQHHHHDIGGLTRVLQTAQNILQASELSLADTDVLASPFFQCTIDPGATIDDLPTTSDEQSRIDALCDECRMPTLWKSVYRLLQCATREFVYHQWCFLTLERIAGVFTERRNERFVDLAVQYEGMGYVRVLSATTITTASPGPGTTTTHCRYFVRIDGGSSGDVRDANAAYFATYDPYSHPDTLYDESSLFRTILAATTSHDDDMTVSGEEASYKLVRKPTHSGEVEQKMRC